MKAIKYVSIWLILLLLLAPIAMVASVKAQENGEAPTGGNQNATTTTPTDEEVSDEEEIEEEFVNETLKNKAEAMLRIAERLINLAKARNVNVTDLEGLLVEAKGYFNATNYNETVTLCMKIMSQVRLRLRETLRAGKEAPVAEGLRKQIELFENYIKKLNETGRLNATDVEELMGKIEAAKEALDKGLVNETAHILTDLRTELRELSVKISEIAKQKAVERALQVLARVREKLREHLRKHLEEFNVTEEEIEVPGIEYLANVSAKGRVIELISKIKKLMEYRKGLWNLGQVMSKVLEARKGVVAAKMAEIRRVIGELAAAERLVERTQEGPFKDEMLNIINNTKWAIHDILSSIAKYVVGNTTEAEEFLNSAEEKVNNNLDELETLGDLTALQMRIVRMVKEANWSLKRIIENIREIMTPEALEGKEVVITGIISWEINETMFVVTGGAHRLPKPPFAIEWHRIRMFRPWIVKITNETKVHGEPKVGGFVAVIGEVDGVGPSGLTIVVAEKVFFGKLTF